MVLGGGIGNIIQATPTIKAIAAAGHKVDLNLFCDTTQDTSIFQIPSVRKIYYRASHMRIEYAFQLNGPFTPGKKNAKKCFRSRVNYAQHIPEAKVYYDLAKRINVTEPMGEIEINIGNKGMVPDEETVVIYPGSKPNWSMKRWNKYDYLARKFKKVLVVGKTEDIQSHGNPGWIDRKWNWPKSVKFFKGSLQEVAFTISKCRMFIGNDGGLAHIAAATGIPTFVLFGPSSVIKNKPFASNAHAIAIEMPCRPCQFKTGDDGLQIFRSGQASCPFNMKCMRDMSVKYVFSQINQKLKS